ncbi:baseplate J/gp47 family protein [Azohydromonas caseinilytica]|uniref:Baseplate protein J-like barrel domain-containing protein n=1 Tax=Azohydromonas caseinilytica TaxID=2728836 RepID=A0A848F3P6_9BURK|nr:baseplate J/gp47 family protein [Azohydromonas caseinilytica]NML13688.1 hypothetical protein [Azohydromonas caseinilytica]
MAAELPFHKKDFAEIVAALLEDAASGRGGRTALTDANGGSVVRTLMEVFAREMAVGYEQLEQVWRSAYLDTASGQALNFVVALVGVQRRAPGHLEGLVTFSRGQGAPQDIHIPAGTLVAGRDQPLFATTEPATLAQGDSLVSVGVLSVEPSRDGKPVPSGALNTMPRPIAGIEAVRNAADLIPRQRAESDEELRQRVRAQAGATTTATVAAIEQAVRALGIAEVKVLEYPADPALLPGQIQVVVGDPDVDAALMQQVHDRIELVRPAGIVVRSAPATRVWVQVTATLTLDSERPLHERKAIESLLTGRLASYFAQLGVGEPVRESKLRSILSSHDAVIQIDSTPGFSTLMEPFVREDGADGALKSQASRYLLSNGDILVGPRERIGLRPAELPVRLTLLGPAPEVLVDIALELAPGGSSEGVADKLRTLVGPLVTAAAKAGRLEFEPLRAKIVGPVLRAEALAGLRITVLHAADGRVVELSKDQPDDALAPRELPRLRNTPVSVSPQ